MSAVDLEKVRERITLCLDLSPEASTIQVVLDAIQLAEEVERLREALAVQKEYTEFLKNACAGTEAIAAIHGMTISEEDFEEGERLRARIAALEEPSDA